MAEFVVVVPKHDELMAVEWAFGTTFGRPDERTPSGVELYRRGFDFGQVTFALLNAQTNTYSSILTADIVAKEAPRVIFMVGTALGRKGQAPIGSVLVSDGVIDISEKRYDRGQEIFVVRGPTRSDEITLDARDFLSRTFNDARAHTQIRSMSRRPALISAPRGMAEFLATHRPAVLCETVVSGNDYRMGGGSGSRMEDIWLHAPTARAYDMEAAGFALAASFSEVPWLVIRGISDHGTPETKSELNRKVAAGIAGTV